MIWLQPRKRGPHFILSDNGNYDFNVKVEHCEFVDFVNDVIDCGCLGCEFCFRIKEKEKDIFYINLFLEILYQLLFYNIPPKLLLLLLFLLGAHDTL